MSLINDALKRAKQAQVEAPPASAPAPQLRPIEDANGHSGKGSWVPLAIIALAAICGLFFFWQLWEIKTHRKPRTVAAAGLPPNLTEATPAQPVPVQSSSAVAAADPAGPSKTQSQVPQVVPVPVQAPIPQPDTSSGRFVPSAAQPPQEPPSASTVPSNIAAAPEGTASTNTPALASAPPAQPEPPRPAPLKLQAISYAGRSSSVMISGKILYLGDRVGELRLASINSESATLIGAGQTNVLTLPH